MVLPEANQTIQADVTVGDTRYRLQCQVDYVLWYGFKADADMLLIIITPKAMDEVRFAAPLAAMCMLITQPMSIYFSFLANGNSVGLSSSESRWSECGNLRPLYRCPGLLFLPYR